MTEKRAIWRGRFAKGRPNFGTLNADVAEKIRFSGPRLDSACDFLSIRRIMQEHRIALRLLSCSYS